ncbi:hypothetical protein SISSUDRAFT_1017588 [Sistotremastrum suecicum HHB10207 ss-3]|uniref:PXA domain-containing protein n=1 Tax=Sistotremastrum suecicum HHB10207 ss-3 TaxID=1314776 RepID=A0A166G6Q3_9AGAM|nr:hypothetical protein SISSUDRAFT_1017588 [Sistotremastrum suecicum HHB10207 ss-3]
MATSGGSLNDARSTTSVLPTKGNQSLAKRLLFPHLPPNTPLPPFLASPAAASQLNPELHEFLALALRAYVQPWWSKISKYDKDFIPSIAEVIIFFSQTVEQRLIASSPHLITALCCDWPNLLEQHYTDYRNATRKVGTSYASGGELSLAALFHASQRHMAIDDQGFVNETYLCLSVEHVMKRCLPPEDWNSEAERAIVRELVVRLLLDMVWGRIAKPWFWMKLTLDLLGPPPESNHKPRQHGRITIHGLLILFLSSVQSLSGFALFLIALVQSTYALVLSVAASSDMPPMPYSGSLTKPSIDVIAQVLSLRNRNTSTAVLSLSYRIVRFLDPFLNRLIPYLFYTYVTPEFLLKVVRLSKTTLFPNNGYPGPPFEEPSVEEQMDIRFQLEERLLQVMPGFLGTLLLGSTEEVRRQTIRDAIDPLSSRLCNIHLLMFLFDDLVLTIFPDLGLNDPASNTDMDGSVEDRDGSLTPPDPLFPP